MTNPIRSRCFRFHLAGALAAAVLAHATPGSTRAGSKDLDYARIAKEALEAAVPGNGGSPPEDFRSYVQATRIRWDLGGVVLWVSKLLPVQDQNARARRVIETQKWLLREAGKDPKPLEADFAEVAKGSGAASSPKARAAAGRLAAAFYGERAEAEDFRKPEILLAESRKAFLTLVALAGHFDEENRGGYWDKNARVWLDFQPLAPMHVVALAYGPLGADADPFLGTEMAPKEADQQIVHRATHLLAEAAFGPFVLPPTLAEGIALNATIEIAGEDETRCTGDLGGNRTEAIDVFVPGLPVAVMYGPGTSAEKSPFRRGPSKTFFFDALRKMCKNDSFQLVGEDDKGKPIPFTLTEPVFGEAAPSVPEDPGARAAYAEFERAYAGGFVKFWRTQRGSKAPVLLSELWTAANEGREVDFASKLLEVTGQSIGDLAKGASNDAEAAFRATLR